MEREQHIDQFSEEFIRKYLDGKLAPADEHRLEKAMLEDPFLADAVEGLSENASNVKEVKGRMKKSLGLARSPVPYFISLLVIGIGGIFVYQLTTNEPVAKENYPKTAEVDESEIEPESPDQQEMKMVHAGKTDSSISFAFEVDENLEQPESPERFVKVERQEEIPPLATPLKNFDSLLAVSSTDNSIDVERPKGNSIYHIENYKVVDYRQLRSVLFTEQSRLPGGLPPSAENEEDTGRHLLPNKNKEEVAYTEFLEQAMIRFANGQFTRALADFEIILGNYPNDANALFYGGLSAYNSGAYSKAEELLKKSHESSISTFSEESEFYLAKSLLAQGKSVEAEELFHAVVAKRGFYYEQAKALLKTI